MKQIKLKGKSGKEKKIYRKEQRKRIINKLIN